MSNYIKSSDIITPNGSNLDALLHTFAKDLDYVRYLPFVVAQFSWPDLVGTASNDYNPFARPTKDSDFYMSHAHEIIPVADDDGYLTLDRYYAYMFFIESTCRISNAATHTNSLGSVGLRLRDDEHTTNFDVGFLSIELGANASGNYDAYCGFSKVIMQSSYNRKIRLIGKSATNFGSDLQYISTYATVLAFPLEGTK